MKLNVDINFWFIQMLPIKLQLCLVLALAYHCCHSQMASRSRILQEEMHLERSIFPVRSVFLGHNSLGKLNLDLLLVYLFLSQVLDLLEDACESLLDRITAQSWWYYKYKVPLLLLLLLRFEIDSFAHQTESSIILSLHF